MRKMLLGIYLILLAIPAFLWGLLGSGWVFIAAILLVVVSAYCFMDGYFTYGPTARENGEEDNDPPPPSYK